MAQGQSLNGPPVACKGERVSRIDIDPNPPFRINGNAIWQRAGRFAARQHVTTRPSVILRYLALQLGDACTEVRRAESERILRAQPFIADASVLAYADGNGGVTLTVTTVDEVSLIVGAGVTSAQPHFRSVLLGEDNLMGSGIHTDVSWKKGRTFRDIYAGKLIDSYGHPDAPERTILISIPSSRNSLIPMAGCRWPIARRKTLAAYDFPPGSTPSARATSPSVRPTNCW